MPGYCPGIAAVLTGHLIMGGCAVVILWINNILLQYDLIIFLQYHITILFYNISILQYHNIIILQYYHITILQHYNIITLQYYHTTILQYYDGRCGFRARSPFIYNNIILQYYHVTIFRRSRASDGSDVACSDYYGWCGVCQLTVRLLPNRGAADLAWGIRAPLQQCWPRVALQSRLIQRNRASDGSDVACSDYYGWCGVCQLTTVMRRLPALLLSLPQFSPLPLLLHCNFSSLIALISVEPLLSILWLWIKWSACG